MDRKNRTYIFAVLCILVVLTAGALYYVFFGGVDNPSDLFNRNTITSYSKEEMPESIEDIDKRTLYPVYINVVTQKQLENIPGVNRSTAAAIIEYREIEGGIFALDELIGVAGINETVVEILSKYVTPYPV